LRHWNKKQEGRSDFRPDLGPASIATIGTPRINTDVLTMPPPGKPTLLSTSLTRQNLEDANASLVQVSIRDKMNRYEGATHIETVEMLTGLRYQEGERSHGISTGDQSPALIRGDVGIAIPIDKDRGGGDKKKKNKMVEEYVCTDCGILTFPRSD